MVSKKEDYSYLLDELREVSKYYYWDKIGRIVDIDGNEQFDDDIVIKTDFYTEYCFAYKAMDEYNETVKTKINREFIDRALTSYGAFNYFINTCIAEYRVYSDIGTGKVSYIPYQVLADYFFQNEAIKETLMEYLKHVLDYVFDEEKSYGRVK